MSPRLARTLTVLYDISMVQFIYGKNSFLISTKLREIEADFAKHDPSGINLSKIDGASLTFGQFEQAISATPFLADKRLVIIRNLQLDNKDSELKNKVAERIGKDQHRNSSQKGTEKKEKDSTDLVFVEMGQPDKRTKLYKDLLKSTASAPRLMLFLTS